MDSTSRQLFRSPKRPRNATTEPSQAAQTLLIKALAAQNCVELCKMQWLRRALEGALEEVLRAGRDGLKPRGIDAAIEVVSIVTAAAQKGEYVIDDIEKVAARVARFPGGAPDSEDDDTDDTPTEVVFAGATLSATSDSTSRDTVPVATVTASPTLALPPVLEDFLRAAADKATSEKPRPQPKPGVKLRSAQPPATPDIYIQLPDAVTATGPVTRQNNVTRAAAFAR